MRYYSQLVITKTCSAHRQHVRPSPPPVQRHTLLTSFFPSFVPSVFRCLFSFALFFPCFFFITPWLASFHSHVLLYLVSHSLRFVLSRSVTYSLYEYLFVYSLPHPKKNEAVVTLKEITITFKNSY